MSLSARASFILLVLGALAAAPACAKSKAPTAPPTPAAGPSVERLSDEQIWKVAEAINHGEATEARVAAQHAKNPSVRDYAKHMIQASMDEARVERDVTLRRGVSPATSRLSEKLTGDGQDNIKGLRQLSEADFDRTYMSLEIRDHQKVINTIDRELLPQARDPELKAELEAMRARVAEHLDEAKRIESELTPAAPKQK